MEESLRLRRQIRKDYFSCLPAIEGSQRPLKQIYNTQNAFKLCKVGVRKSKFINFDLKYTEDENAMQPRQSNIRIPLLAFNKNRFSPLRQHRSKSPIRNKHRQSLPPLVCYSDQPAKFTRPKQLSEIQPTLFIT